MAYTNLSDLFKGICDAIRAKKGKTGNINHQDIPSEIAGILSPSDGSIPTKTSNNLSVSGATVTVPAGYYASNASKSISSGALSSPSISVSSSGVITATSGVSTSGYLSTSASKSNTKSLTTQGAKTITPSTSSQTAVASGVYTTGAITVGAIPSEYVKPTKKYSGGVTTLEPGGAVTTEAGSYFSGAWTIKAAASGGSGYVGSSISSSRQSYNLPNSYCIFEDIDTANLIGFVLDIEGNDADAPSSWTETIVGGLYTKSNGFLYATIDEDGKYWGFSKYSKCTVEISGTTITIASGSSDVRLDITFDYCIYPIYSA